MAQQEGSVQEQVAKVQRHLANMQHKFTSLCIAIPAYDGQTTVQTTNSLVETFNDLNITGMPWTLKMSVGDSLIARSRNTLAAMFLMGESSHLFFVDSDMQFPAWAARKLVMNDYDVVGATYKTRKHDLKKYTMNFLPGSMQNLTRDPRTGCLKIYTLGTGNIMIHRSALEKMAKAHPEWKLVDDNPDIDPWLFNWFQTAASSDHKIHDAALAVVAASKGVGSLDDAIKRLGDAAEDAKAGSRYVGEDVFFCTTWVDEFGGDVWLDPIFTPGHVGVYVYGQGESVMDLFDVHPEPPPTQPSPEQLTVAQEVHNG
jgi:hypothetical protein